MEMQIRTATLEDAESILNIYQHYVRNTAISFEYDAPSLEEFQNRMKNTMKKYPYLVAVEENKILGYAYAGAFYGRAAYDWSVETTVYVEKGLKKRGVGKALYQALEEKLKKMGILNLYACIAYPVEEDEYLDKNSAEFHAHMGYAKVGEFHKCGYKFGRWYHMIWMEKLIGEHK